MIERPENAAFEREVLRLAAMIAQEAPRKRGKHVLTHAKVRWNLIDQLRSALDTAGIAWRA